MESETNEIFKWKKFAFRGIWTRRRKVETLALNHQAILVMLKWWQKSYLSETNEISINFAVIWRTLTGICCEDKLKINEMFFLSSNF